jgi:uncharacterized protein YjbI with pentapeptide repeats
MIVLEPETLLTKNDIHEGANLSGVDIPSADLRDAKLKEADPTEAAL